MGLILFGVRAVFSIDACHLFPRCMLIIIPLIGMTDVVVTRPWPEYLMGPPLCSVIVNAVSGVGSAP